MTATARHLLVDGFNVIHAHPPWKALLPRDVGAAREALVEAVRVLHDFDGWRVTVVFDGSGETLAVEQPGPEATLAVVTTPAGVSADAILEQLVTASREPEALVVATRDGAIRQVAQVAGAEVWKPSQLLERVAATGARQARDLRARRERDGRDGFNPLLGL